MTDLVNELLEALERYDTTMSSWIKLRVQLPRQRAHYRAAVPIDDLDRVLYAYVTEQIIRLRVVNGSVEADQAIKALAREPLEAVLVMAGRLQPSQLADALIIYAAHLAALTSYGEAVWGNVVEVVVMEALATGEMRVQ